MTKPMFKLLGALAAVGVLAVAPFRRERGSIVRRRGRRRGRLRRQQCPVVPVGSHLVGQQRRRALLARTGRRQRRAQRLLMGPRP